MERPEGGGWGEGRFELMAAWKITSLGSQDLSMADRIHERLKMRALEDNET